MCAKYSYCPNDMFLTFTSLLFSLYHVYPYRHLGLYHDNMVTLPWPTLGSCTMTTTWSLYPYRHLGLVPWQPHGHFTLRHLGLVPWQPHGHFTLTDTWVFYHDNNMITLTLQTLGSFTTTTTRLLYPDSNMVPNSESHMVQLHWQQHGAFTLSLLSTVT